MWFCWKFHLFKCISDMRDVNCFYIMTSGNYCGFNSCLSNKSLTVILLATIRFRYQILFFCSFSLIRQNYFLEKIILSLWYLSCYCASWVVDLMALSTVNKLSLVVPWFLTIHCEVVTSTSTISCKIWILSSCPKHSFNWSCSKSALAFPVVNNFQLSNTN